MDKDKVLVSIRRANVNWIFKYMVAITAGCTEAVIEEKPKYTKYYCKESNRTVIVNTKEKHHLMHFMLGTQQDHTEYFTLIVDFNHVVTVPAELIIKYLYGGVSKQRTIEWLKILSDMDD
jgi:hypothetical protein